MPLGSALTSKFNIGTAELRIGPVNVAGKMDASYRVGLIDNAVVSVSQESVDLEGGFPKVILDTAVVSQSSGVTATLREYSSRNINVLLGNAVAGGLTPSATVKGVIADYVAPVYGSTTDGTITLTAGNVAAMNAVLPADYQLSTAKAPWVVFYDETDPQKTFTAKVNDVTGEVLTIDYETAPDAAVLANDGANGWKLAVLQPSAIGAIQQTNYFAATLIQLQRGTSVPVGFHFWKCAISSGMEYGTNADDFASTEFAFKALQLTGSDTAAGAGSVHLSALASAYPTGMFFGTPD